MTRDEFSELLDEIQSEERKVREQGQDEYAHDDNNCFANFDRVGEQSSIDRKHVLLVYALKHWDGIISYIKGHRSQREDIRGRIKDLRCYLALLWGMIEEEENPKPIVSREEIRNHLGISTMCDCGCWDRVDRNLITTSIYPNCAYCGAPYEAHEEVGKLGERGHRINAPTQPQHGQYHAFTPLPSRTKCS